MDIDGITRIGSTTPPKRTGAANDAGDGARFADVIDLTAARRARITDAERIPDDVWESVQRAGELASDLAASGRQVRFDTHMLTGRVVATLCDADGRRLRPLALGEVLGADPDPAPAA